MEQLHEKVSILNNSRTYLKSFFKQNEYLIITLKNKLSLSEKQLAQSSSVVNKLMMSSNKLNEIISRTKLFNYIRAKVKISCGLP